MSTSRHRQALSALLAALLLAGLLPAAPATADDEGARFTQQIIGGEEDPSGEQPWTAALVTDAGDPAGTAFCGGTLIAPRWVVTAAHCFDEEADRDPLEAAVLLDTVDLRDPGEVRTVEEEVRHPDYDPDSPDFDDVLLLRLDEAAAAPPLPLADPGRPGTHAPGIDATAWGWGDTEYGDDEDYPDIVHRVDLPILTDEDCVEGLEGDYTAATMLCAGIMPGADGEPIDTCDGDSGGPLAVPGAGGWLLAGVTSFGIADCGEAPGVYMRATTYADWIIGEIGPLARPRAVGDDRIGTALAAAHAGWETADTALVATATDFADALAGAGLAATLDAPLLLTDPDALPGRVASAVDDLEVEDVIVLGGSAAVSDSVVDALEGLSGEPTVERVFGDDRFGTAAAAAAEAGAPGGVAVASGRAFPDAVSAATYSAGAADQRRPILLAEPDDLPDATVDALTDLEVDDVVVVGGSAAVSDSVVAALEGVSGEPTVERVYGPDRYATSRAVAEDHAGAFDGRHDLVMATGANFPDALAAGALAATRGGRVLLVPPDPDPATEGWVGASDQTDRLRWLWLLGGSAAVSEEAWHGIQDAATRR